MSLLLVMLVLLCGVVWCRLPWLWAHSSEGLAQGQGQSMEEDSVAGECA